MEPVYSEYVVPAYDLNDIVCRMSESEWTLAEAQYWADRLTERGFVITDVYEFYADVKSAFAPFHVQMIKGIGVESNA